MRISSAIFSSYICPSSFRIKSCTSCACSGVAVRPVPMAQTGSYAMVTAMSFSALKPARPSFSCRVTTSFVCEASRSSRSSPTHKIGKSPPAIAAATFLFINSSDSPITCRRSEWPQRQYKQPTSFSIEALISPVKAPSGSKYISWAPTAILDELRAFATACKYTKGGQTATVTLWPAVSTDPEAIRSTSSTLV